MMPGWASAGFAELGDMIELGLGDQVLFLRGKRLRLFLESHLTNAGALPPRVITGG